MKLHISLENMKMGKVPSSSLIPVKDCTNCKACNKECYAMKAWRLYPTVRKAWGENSKLLRSNPYAWEQGHISWITKHKPKYFRFNVGGDIISKTHYFHLLRICEACPDTKFLIFTKSFKYIHANIPNNLTLVLSLFPRMKVPKKLEHLPRAYAYKSAKDYAQGTGDMRFARAVECLGGCDTCGICWDIQNMGKDVKFEMH